MTDQFPAPEWFGAFLDAVHDGVIIYDRFCGSSRRAPRAPARLGCGRRSALAALRTGKLYNASFSDANHPSHGTPFLPLFADLLRTACGDTVGGRGEEVGPVPLSMAAPLRRRRPQRQGQVRRGFHLQRDISRRGPTRGGECVASASGVASS